MPVIESPCNQVCVIDAERMPRHSPAKPPAHVMLTMREVNEDGFGGKVRDWNKTELVQEWRERRADHVNERLAELDIDARIDHRSLTDQGIDLESQNKIGPAASRMVERGLEVKRRESFTTICLGWRAALCATRLRKGNVCNSCPRSATLPFRRN